MSVPDLVAGRLPLGRHPASLDEVESAFVGAPAYSGSTTRQGLWTEFALGLATLRSPVTVHAVWISGSFITDKLDPADIDATFLVNANQRYNHIADGDRRVVDSFLIQTDPATGERFRPHGLRIDSFVLDWGPYHGDPRTDPGYHGYTMWRGYWDDFWLRERTDAKEAPFVAADSVPRRGYVEVSLDVYE